MTDRDTVVLTVPEAAKRLKISERSTWKWISEGKIPSIRLEGRVLVIADELDRFLRTLPSASSVKAAPSYVPPPDDPKLRHYVEKRAKP